jgi:hypothetical protein
MNTTDADIARYLTMITDNDIARYRAILDARDPYASSVPCRRKTGMEAMRNRRNPHRPPAFRIGSKKSQTPSSTTSLELAKGPKENLS